MKLIAAGVKERASDDEPKRFTCHPKECLPAPIAVRPSRSTTWGGQLDKAQMKPCDGLSAGEMRLYADCLAAVLLDHCERLRSPANPLPALDHAAIVQVLGHRIVEQRRPFVAYVIFFSSRAAPCTGEGCEARLVQRRFSEFDRLRRTLLPIARRHALVVPPLPTKFPLPQRLQAIGTRREGALHAWLQWVIGRRELWCPELCQFFGLSAHPQAASDELRAPKQRERSVSLPERLSALALAARMSPCSSRGPVAGGHGRSASHDEMTMRLRESDEL
jgi:hypothetical protein